jgi:hypothetical protein
MGDMAFYQTVTVSSSAVSSMCGAMNLFGLAFGLPMSLGTPYPFNFNDLQGPVPASAYECASSTGLFPGPITDQYYAPMLNVPSQITELRPEWSDCYVIVQGAYDPPTALGLALFVADPTTIGSPSGPSASPRITPPSPVGVSTPAPSATASNGDPPRGSNPANPPQTSSSPHGPGQKPPPPGSFEEHIMSSRLSSLVKNLPGKSGGSSLLVIDPNNPSAIRTLHSGDVISGSKTVLAFDPDSGLLVLSGSTGATEVRLPSMVVGLATKTTVMVLPRAIMTPAPTASAGSGTGSFIMSGLGGPDANDPDSNDPRGSNLSGSGSGDPGGPSSPSATFHGGNGIPSSTSAGSAMKGQPNWLAIIALLALSLFREALHSELPAA